MKRMLVIALALLAGAGAAAQELPEVYMAPYAHMDTQWRWNIQQTIGEFIPNTLLQNFALFEEYPDYIFNFEGGDKYAWVKEYYPDLFEKLKAYVAAGRWHVSGSSWDANDHNMPSVESCIRNYLLGQQFYEKEFGVRGTDVLLPDCFGFAYTLPSIAAHCGLIGFSTQKLQWRARPFYEGGKKIPFRYGIWEGIDGSRLLAVMDGGNYAWNPDGDVSDLPELHRFIADNREYGVNAAFRYFGTRSSQLSDDRGGSPTPKAVSLVDDAIKHPKGYQMRFAATDDFFKKFNNADELPVFKGELLMDIHATGCYTSHSELKNINRRNEVLLGSVESAGVLADWYGAMPYPAFPLSEGWKRLVSHQFHDDLTGTSEPSVYQFTYSDEYVIRSQMQALLAREVEALSAGLDTRGKGIALAVYNPVPSRNRDCVRATVSLPAKYRSVEVYGPDGKRVPSQIVSRSGDCAEILFAADVPSLGVAVYDVRPSKSAEPKGTIKASGRTLENDIYRIALDKNGDIASLVDKRSGRELVREGEAFSLLTWDDNWSGNWPAWEIFKHVMDRKPSRVASAVKISLEEQGPLRASLRVERTQGPSTFVQHIRLTSGAQDDRIDVFNEIDWQSKETLLKASFPTVFDAPEAAYDLGMAHVRRGVNTETSYEVYAHGWADMTAADGSAGLTVLNDSKYGWDHPDAGTLRLTLLHTPKVDRAYEQYQSTMDLGRHCFTYSLVSHDGVLDAAEATRLADGLNRPMQAYAVPSHKGTAGKTLSLASSTHPSLKIGAVKRAEDGDGYVVRVYELSGQGASGDIVFPGEIVSAQELNGIEDVKGAASFAGKALRVHADPFTLHTFRVRLASPAQAIAPADYVPLNLPFNTVALSSDGFSAFGHMDADWHSYAAELIPADFVFGGIPFALGRADYDNALRCGGQTLELPDGTASVSLLVASSGPDKEVVFDGGVPVSRKVENWTGFYGAYGWQGHYDSFCRTGKVAYHGTHRHDSRKRNEIYVSTYMYLVEVPVTAGALRLPDDRDIVVFAATAKR